MRPDRLNPLFADVGSLPGVGPAAHRALERLEIGRVRDLAKGSAQAWIHKNEAQWAKDYPEWENGLLFCATEMLAKEDMDRVAEILS